MGTRIRLQAIFDMVTAPCVAADIGCDHGRLPIALVKYGKCQKAYACDINPGPLSRAMEAIAHAGLQNQVIPLLSDGLSLVPADVTTFIIAGMGYDTITHILKQDMVKLQACQQLILQCNGHVDLLRAWLSKEGFQIDQECIIKDHHYYQLLSLHYEPGRILTEEECLFGLYMYKDPHYVDYWNHVLIKKQIILQNMQKEHDNYRRIQHEIALIQKEMKRMSSE